jgi:molybdopterin converting factor small subunit
MPSIKVPTPLRSYTNGEVEVKVEGNNVGEAMSSLVAKFPPLKPHLYNGDGNLRPFVNLFVGGQNVKDLEGLATKITDESRLLLVPSIAGG